MVGGRQHGGFEWASRALSLRWFISDSAQIMEYQGACTEALLVYAHVGEDNYHFAINGLRRHQR